MISGTPPLPTLSKTHCLPVLFPSWRSVQGGGLEGLGEKAGDSGFFGKLGEAEGSWERGHRSVDLGGESGEDWEGT